MAITIRNQRLEADLRELGAEFSEGPSATIARLVANEKKRLHEVERLELTRRRSAMAELLGMLPKLAEVDKAEMDRRLADMDDEGGLPR